MSGEHSYEAAGVSLAKAVDVVERLRAAVESTGAEGFGAFAGLYPLDERRLLAASTDSIGTKPIVARERGALRSCGADMAAHCINDVITTGAEPLFLLDYVAASELDLEQVADLVDGAAEVCREAGCALLGGETAELPGVYREGELDFAATCVGDRRPRRAGRRLASRGGRRDRRPPLRGHARERLHARPPHPRTTRTTTGPTCSAPTRLYLDDVRASARRPTCARSHTSPAAESPATSSACSRTACGP